MDTDTDTPAPPPPTWVVLLTFVIAAFAILVTSVFAGLLLHSLDPDVLRSKRSRACAVSSRAGSHRRSRSC